MPLYKLSSSNPYSAALQAMSNATNAMAQTKATTTKTEKDRSGGDVALAGLGGMASGLKLAETVDPGSTQRLYNSTIQTIGNAWEKGLGDQWVLDNVKNQYQANYNSLAKSLAANKNLSSSDIMSILDNYQSYQNGATLADASTSAVNPLASSGYQTSQMAANQIGATIPQVSQSALASTYPWLGTGADAATGATTATALGEAGTAAAATEAATIPTVATAGMSAAETALGTGLGTAALTPAADAALVGGEGLLSFGAGAGAEAATDAAALTAATGGTAALVLGLGGLALGIGSMFW